MGPGIGAALIGAGGALASNIWNAFEARRNRNWQERMSSTAHQREVADLRKAGINPMMRGLSGASTPSGDRAEMRDVAGAGLSSALMARQASAQIRLTDAQARLANTQANDISSTFSNRMGLMSAQEGLSNMTREQMMQMLPLALDKAREEIRLTSSSAEAASARAVLDRAAAAGAINQEDFEKLVRTAGPATRMVLEILRTLRRPK